MENTIFAYLIVRYCSPAWCLLKNDERVKMSPRTIIVTIYQYTTEIGVFALRDTIYKKHQ